MTDALRKANPKELARFLEGEQPQTIALILAYLDAKAASALVDAVARIAAGGGGGAAGVVAKLFSRNGEKVSVVLHKRNGESGRAERAGYPGFKGAADVMNRLEPEAMKAVSTPSNRRMLSWR